MTHRLLWVGTVGHITLQAQSVVRLVARQQFATVSQLMHSCRSTLTTKLAHRSRKAPGGCAASAASAASRVTAKPAIAAGDVASHSCLAPASRCMVRMNQSLWAQKQLS